MKPSMLSLERLVSKINYWRATLNALLTLMHICQTLIMAFVLYVFAASISPDTYVLQLGVFVVSLIVLLFLKKDQKVARVKLKDKVLALEIRYSEIKQSPFLWANQRRLAPEIETLLLKELDDETARLWRLMGAASLRFLGPVLLCALMLAAHSPDFLGLWGTSQKFIYGLRLGVQLKVLEGTTHAAEHTYSLSKSPVTITLMEHNVLELNSVASKESSPTVWLKDSHGRLIQTFQLIPDPTDTWTGDLRKFTLRFTVSEDAELFFSQISQNRPSAKIKLNKLPLPRVRMQALIDLEKSWPDDKPVPLQISVESERPLQIVNLQIKTGKQIKIELVNQVIADNVLTLQNNYQLHLEPYVTEDEQEVELRAEAVDRSFPQALTGLSKTLVVRVVSAYGRYRQALKTLLEAKTILDANLVGSEEESPQNLSAIIHSLKDQVDDSPYFDGLDRMQIMQFQEGLVRVSKAYDPQLMAQLSENLGQFLFEHETLDDRERDRDYFVAIRNFSRLIEQGSIHTVEKLSRLALQIEGFLNERHRRWTLRVNRLDADLMPASWSKIQKMIFQSQIQDVNRLMQEPTEEHRSKSLKVLSQAGSEYRAWLDELEKSEDLQRQKQEQKRQDSIANAQNKLRELQKRQANISQKLDRAAERSPEDLAQNWNAARLDQNSNIAGTRELEGQLRSFSPPAAQRLKSALQSMMSGASMAEDRNYSAAESASDLAGRLLQQAESAAQRSKQEQSQRGRRRRVSGDQFHGQQISGGDIDLSRDYQVERRYREDVLDDVQAMRRQDNSPESEGVLQEYLRKVVR